jgi:hypothetical protein
MENSDPHTMLRELMLRELKVEPVSSKEGHWHGRMEKRNSNAEHKTALRCD